MLNPLVDNIISLVNIAEAFRVITTMKIASWYLVSPVYTMHIKFSENKLYFQIFQSRKYPSSKIRLIKRRKREAKKKE